MSAGLWLLFALAFTLTQGDALLGTLPLLLALLYLGLAWRGPAKLNLGLTVFRISSSVALAVFTFSLFGPAAVGFLAVVALLMAVLIHRRLRRQSRTPLDVGAPTSTGDFANC